MRSLPDKPFAERRAALEKELAEAEAPIHLTAATADRDVARAVHPVRGGRARRRHRQPLDIAYEPDKRLMFKIKHERTADCVVAGYRVHKSGPDAIGSLLLALR